MTSSTDVSVSMTTSTPEPTGRVIQLFISIPSTSVPVNQTFQQNIGQEIRDQFSLQLSIDSRIINRVVLIFIDENNVRNEVARISFNSRKRRQSNNDSVTFNAIELDIQTTDESQAVEVQNMIDELSNMVSIH